MKKTLTVIAVLCIAVACAGCTKKVESPDTPINEVINSEQTAAPFPAGSYKVLKIKEKKSNDGSIEAVAAGILKNYFKEGGVLLIFDDGSAEIDGRSVDIKEEGGKIYLTWDGSKTFMFDAESDDDGFKLIYGKYLTVEFGGIRNDN